MALYNITRGNKAAPNNHLGIFEDLGDVYSQTDLNDFFLALAPYIPQGTHPTLDAIDGAVAPTTVANAGPESDLDFQISYPIIWPQNSVLYQTDDPVYEANYTYEGFLNNFLDAIVRVPWIPPALLPQPLHLPTVANDCHRTDPIAHTQPSARQATALLTHLIRIQPQVATKASSSAASTTSARHPSSPFRTEARKPTCQ